MRRRPYAFHGRAQNCVEEMNAAQYTILRDRVASSPCFLPLFRRPRPATAFRSRSPAPVLSSRPVLDLTESNPTRAAIRCTSGRFTRPSPGRFRSYEPAPFGIAPREKPLRVIFRVLASIASRVVLTASTSEASAIPVQALPTLAEVSCRFRATAFKAPRPARIGSRCSLPPRLRRTVARRPCVGARFVPLNALTRNQELRIENQVFVSDIFAHTELLAAPVFESANSNSAENSRTRPNLKVQDGCDNRCSFCVIPSVRGHSRSLPYRT